MKDKKTVLIIDDNHENIKVLATYLMDADYEVGIASSGDMAYEFIEHRLPDLILLDVMMPLVSGYDVCRELKKNFHIADIPIIFLTAKTSTEDIVAGFDAGGVDYISKPFNGVELLARVKTHIEMKVLRGLLPICSSCKGIRDDDGYWHSIEDYIGKHSGAQFSHSLCPVCAEKLYSEKKWYKSSS